MSTKAPMRRHLAHRFGWFVAGILLLYAPFALLTRGVLLVTGDPLIPDVHRICLRMPIEWLGQPWMYPTLASRPTSFVVVLLLPLLALLLGPLFCGWLCPPGAFTEFLSRLVPDRFKINLAGRIDPAPVRYGATVGMMAAPFLDGSACCAFCNFSHMQNIVNAATGNLTPITHWASFLIVTFAVWLVIGGLFTKGGRLWCNFLCPAGAMMGLFHAIGRRFGIARGVAAAADKEPDCKACGQCVAICPAWAISINSPAKVNPHACNACLDCLHACAQGVLTYGYHRPGPAAAASGSDETVPESGSAGGEHEV